MKKIVLFIFFILSSCVSSKITKYAEFDGNSGYKVFPMDEEKSYAVIFYGETNSRLIYAHDMAVYKALDACNKHYNMEGAFFIENLTDKYIAGYSSSTNIIGNTAYTTVSPDSYSFPKFKVLIMCVEDAKSILKPYAYARQQDLKNTVLNRVCSYIPKEHNDLCLKNSERTPSNSRLLDKYFKTNKPL